MKIEELLQKIIDLASGDETVEFTEPHTDEIGVFLPPLQANIELMRKATGVDNVIDDEEAECGEFDDEWQEMAADPDDELQAIRKNAGLPIDAEPIDTIATVIAKPAIVSGF
jgi:hypothetical protein